MEINADQDADNSIVHKNNCAIFFSKKRKPMLPLKTLDIINKRRYVRNTQYYLTNRKHAITGKPPEEQSRSFLMPGTEKLLSYLRYTDKKRQQLQRQLSQKPIHMKDNLRFASTRNISSRLYIEEPSDDVRTVLETHPEFYNVIEGRPLRTKDDIKSYITTIRNYAMHRQQIGYRRDMIIQIEKNISEEEKENIDTSKSLSIYIHNFQHFLTEDYKSAQALVAQAEVIEAYLAEANSKLLAVSACFTILNNNMFKLESIRSILKFYRRYLFLVAPLTWRKQYAEIVKISQSDCTDDDELIDYFDLDKILQHAKEELLRPNAPYLYFDNPQQMLYLFRTLELQSREYLIHLSKTNLPHRMLHESIKKLKQLTSLELEQYNYLINYFKDAINREMCNESYLQTKFYRILEDYFFDSVASPITLKLRICINFVYEQIFGKCEEEFENVSDPMRILEVLYEDINLKLDSLDLEVVTKARDENFAQDLKMMFSAHSAQRELKSFREMTNSMKRAFLPPAKFKRPPFTKFVNKKERSAQAREERIRAKLLSGERVKYMKPKVTPEQLECLLFFTTWREGLNPEPFLKEYETYVKPVFEQPSEEHIFSVPSRFIK